MRLSASETQDQGSVSADQMQGHVFEADEPEVKPDYVVQDERYAARFNSLAKSWRVRSGLSTRELAGAAELVVATPPGPQAIQKLERGEYTRGTPAVFFALFGRLNEMTFMQDLSRFDEGTADKLSVFEPYLDEHGKPWGPLEFYNFYLGPQDFPRTYSCMSVVPSSPEAAKNTLEMVRNNLYVLAGSTRDPLELVQGACDGMEEEDAKRFRLILLNPQIPGNVAYEAVKQLTMKYGDLNERLVNA